MKQPKRKKRKPCPVCGKPPKNRAAQAAEVLALTYMSPGEFA